MRGRKTLLLDVDETLVHSSFTPTDKAHIVLPIDIEGRTCNIYVLVRPGCVDFIKEVAKYFEVVIFTASLSKYAIPLMNILDDDKVAPQRLFREHCTYFNGLFVKDMARVGRRMEDIIIIDNSPNSYQFQPENGIPILSWYDDPTDIELMRFVPALRLLAQVDDVRPVVLQSTFENEFNVDLAIKICQSLIILKNKKLKEEREAQEKAAREKAAR
jgi:carboxy-terminal domain RNA polymerase II polypeptide A small phosphatase